jgi:hypothetical protein
MTTKRKHTAASVAFNDGRADARAGRPPLQQFLDDNLRRAYLRGYREVAPLKRGTNPKQTLRQEREAKIDPFVRRHFDAFVRRLSIGNRRLKADAWRLYMTDPEYWNDRGWPALFDALRSKNPAKPRHLSASARYGAQIVRELEQVKRELAHLVASDRRVHSTLARGKNPATLERCVRAVKRRGKKVRNAYAICAASIKRGKNARRRDVGYVLMARKRGKLYRYLGKNRFSPHGKPHLFATLSKAQRAGRAFASNAPRGVEILMRGPVTVS